MRKNTHAYENIFSQAAQVKEIISEDKQSLSDYY